VSTLELIHAKLVEAQTKFFRAADVIPAEQWRIKPGAGAWSAAELVAHLMMVERAILGGADRITQKTPRRVSLLRRMHLPLWLVESRLIRRKTPIPLDASLVGNKEEMLAELRGVRECTLAFMEETRGRDLSAYCWPHAFLGMLNVYQWFEMIGAHQVRHTKQIREVAARLPKDVGKSQKR
jgi:DinB superfamily